MSANENRVPPGPRGWPLLGMALQVLRDPLGTLQRIAREYGDIVTIPIVSDTRILLNHPDYIEQVTVIQQSKFHKSKLTKDVTGRLLGEGLLISEGDFWRRQRRLAQPAFQRNRINEYAATMVESAEAHSRKWQDSEERDIAPGNDGAHTGNCRANTLRHHPSRRSAASWALAGISDALFTAQSALAFQSCPKNGPRLRIAGPSAKFNFSIRWYTGSLTNARSSEMRTSTTTCFHC